MTAKPPDLPDRGHLVWISLDPQVGHEQAGRRFTTGVGWFAAKIGVIRGFLAQGVPALPALLRLATALVLCQFHCT